MRMQSPLFKPLLVAVLLAATTLAAAAPGGPQGSTHLSNASNLVADGSATVIGGSLLTVAAAGSVVVASVEVAGDASVLVLRGAADGVTASVRLSGQAARNASNVAGASVEVVALSTGYLLVTAGRVIAFVPNEIGRALLHSSRVAERQ
ncbi:MAG: hypothetical protein JWP59_2920 [Massilia sp.]|nr:hypothetical protein [Massilia sp.]